MITEINRYVKTWEGRCYFKGIPDEAPKEIEDKVPSYKMIALAILKNDLSYIGVEPPKSEYYSLLKCAELNIKYKKPKRMTQSGLREFIFKLTQTMIEKKCYIKGYGDKYRIMDELHSPVRNVAKGEFAVLVENKIVERDGLVYKLSVTSSPFTHYLDVKLPK